MPKVELTGAALSAGGRHGREAATPFKGCALQYPPEAMEPVSRAGTGHSVPGSEWVAQVELRGGVGAAQVTHFGARARCNWRPLIGVKAESIQQVA